MCGLRGRQGNTNWRVAGVYINVSDSTDEKILIKWVFVNYF